LFNVTLLLIVLGSVVKFSGCRMNQTNQPMVSDVAVRADGKKTAFRIVWI